MWFFAKLFGGDHKKEDVPQAPHPKSEAEENNENRLEAETIFDCLDTKVKVIEEGQNQIEDDNEKLKNKIRELAKAGMNQQITQCFDGISKAYCQAQGIMILKKVNLGKGSEIDQDIGSMGTGETVKKVDKPLEEQEEQPEKRQDIVLDNKVQEKYVNGFDKENLDKRFPPIQDEFEVLMKKTQSQTKKSISSSIIDVPAIENKKEIDEILPIC